MGVFSGKSATEGRKPDSVAIIMDGNGRWATKRGLPRSAGHVAGAKIIEDVVTAFYEHNVHHLTLYAFSTENWKRPEEEVNGLMELIYKYLDEVVIAKIKADPDFSMRFLGDKSVLSEKLRNNHGPYGESCGIDPEILVFQSVAASVNKIPFSVFNMLYVFDLVLGVSEKQKSDAHGNHAGVLNNSFP